MKRALLLVITALWCAACNPSKSEIDRKIDDLLAAMTLEEKIGQLNLISPSDPAAAQQLIAAGSVGAMLNVNDPVQVNEYQKTAVETSKHGIPLLIGRDVIHGYRTIFPIPIGQAATFNPAIVETGARVAAAEASAAGIRWTFSPMVDIARDPRWGRIAEGSGEDTYLNSVMGAATVRGYQGDDLTDPTSMAACVKHYAGYGASEGGRDYNTTKIPMRELRNFYLPPFKAAIEAGAASVMTSFNEIDGVPSTANRLLLRDILRNEWGFGGVVVSDWNSLGEMVAHGFAMDNRQASAQAINAGLDLDMATGGFASHLKELVDSGEVSETTIDQAARNVLKLKYRLGLFDNPYVDPQRHKTENYAPEHLAAAKQCATESAILLKNDPGTLPQDGVQRILVTGPMADAPHDQLGTWCFDGEASHTVTPLAALRSTKGLTVDYVPGLAFSRDNSTAQFGAVTSAGRRADAVVVFVGEESFLTGEAHSLAGLDLQGAQSGLIAAAKASGKPVVVVVMAGRPLTIERDLANCNALLYQFHPGTMGGEAIADLLTGKVSPSGKTPVTFLRTVGQVPTYYNHNSTGRPVVGNERVLADIQHTTGQTSLGSTSFYLDAGWKPLFPFGFGLSYTTFEYADICSDKAAYAPQDTIRIAYTLRNSGTRDGVEVAQLYVRDMVGSTVRPVKELRRFERVALKAGEQRSASFELPVAELAFWGMGDTCGVEPGTFSFWVAGDSASGEAGTFEIR